MSCSGREGCATSIASPFPITSGYIARGRRGMRTIPNCIKRNGCVVGVASSSTIGCTCGTARCTPTHERVPTTSRNNGRQREGDTISLGLTRRSSRTAVCVVTYGVRLNCFFGVSAVVTYRNSLSTGGGACKVMSFVAYRSDSRGAGRAVAIILMLCAAVLLVLCGLGMGAVFIGGIIAVVTILCSSVLTGGIIRPISVVVRAVRCACRGNYTAVVANAFPITSSHVKRG